MDGYRAYYTYWNYGTTDPVNQSIRESPSTGNYTGENKALSKAGAGSIGVLVHSVCKCCVRHSPLPGSEFPTPEHVFTVYQASNR